MCLLDGRRNAHVNVSEQRIPVFRADIRFVFNGGHRTKRDEDFEGEGEVLTLKLHSNDL